MTEPEQIHRELIDRLTGELTAGPPLRPLWQISALWLVVGGCYTFLLAALLGPYRPGFVEQLIAHPRFALEMLLGAGALVCFAWVAFAGSIPGVRVAWARRLGWLLGSAWLAQFLIGFAYPALEPSMLGKREHCALEAYLYSVPLLVAALWLQHRRFPLEPVRSALLAAVAAGTLPALMMQVACMHAPGHALQFHVLPGVGLVVVAGVGAYLARRLRG